MSTPSESQEQQAPLNLIEAFKARHSTRTYQGQNLTQQQKDIITQSVTESNALETPFHSQGVEVSSTEPGLGRMGFISGEAGWIVEKLPIAQDQQDNDAERKRIIDVSYIAQHVVMKLAQNHINTVWIAGSYNEGEADFKVLKFQQLLLMELNNLLHTSWAELLNYLDHQLEKEFHLNNFSMTMITKD